MEKINEIKLPFALGEKVWVIRSYDTKTAIKCEHCGEIKFHRGQCTEIVEIVFDDVDASMWISDKGGISCRFIYRPHYKDENYHGASDMILWDQICGEKEPENRYIFRTKAEAEHELAKRVASQIEQ